MTQTGLAAKDGTLQEGDLILKVNVSNWEGGGYLLGLINFIIK